MSFKVVIPARLASTRLPRKVLRDIGGRPLIAWVVDAARRSGAEEVILAVDDAEVEAVAADFGIPVVMTKPEHPSGTDRIHEVAVRRDWPGDTIVVNVQGDEPLMPPELISNAAQLLANDPQADIATLCHPLHALEEWLDPNVVKLVRDARGRALYFSRAPIPWQRDGASRSTPKLPTEPPLRHIGIYAYRVAALKHFAALPPAPLEQVEALEQLRALWNGLTILAGVVEQSPPRGVDTEEDLATVIAYLTPASGA